MKLLACWPIPEAFVCLIIGIVAVGIAGGGITDLPASLLVVGGIVLSITVIVRYLRARYDPSFRRWWQNRPDSEPQPHNPQDRQL